MDAIKKLRQIIIDHYANNQSAFARAIDRSPSQVNQWLTGYRTLDAKACRHIEMRLKLPRDYFLGVGVETNVHFIAAHDDITTAEIIKIARQLDPIGKGMLLVRAREVAKEREDSKKTKRA